MLKEVKDRIKKGLIACRGQRDTFASRADFVFFMPFEPRGINGQDEMGIANAGVVFIDHGDFRRDTEGSETRDEFRGGQPGLDSGRSVVLNRYAAKNA